MKKFFTLIAAAFVALTASAFNEEWKPSADATSPVTLDHITAVFKNNTSKGSTVGAGTWTFGASDVRGDQNGLEIDFTPTVRGKLSIVFAAAVAKSKSFNMTGDLAATVISDPTIQYANAAATDAEVAVDDGVYYILEAGTTYTFFVGGTKWRLRSFSFTDEGLPAENPGGGDNPGGGQGGATGTKYVWSVADVTGGEAVLKSIIVNNPDATQASVFEATEGPVTIKGVSGPVAGFKDYDTADEADKPAELEKTYDNTWSGLKTQGDCEKGPFYYVQGKGNPVDLSKVEIEAVTSEGMFNGKYRAKWDNSYYVIDGSNGLCSNGTYMTLTSTEAGQMSAQVWVNKGNRAVYVVPASTKVALTPAQISVSGYVNGENNAESQKRFIEPNTELTYDAVESNGVTKYYVMHHNWDADHTVDSGRKTGQATFVYLTWNAVAGETYYVFNDNTQIGIGGFEFVSNSTDGIQSVVAPVIMSNKIYNLAGQVVDASYRGVVIKNGKKMIQK